MVSNKKILIGTVGYHVLGNHSLPPKLLPRLQELNWPENVTLDELNWGPVAVVQMLESENPCFDKVIILCAVERPGRIIGEIDIWQWKGRVPDAEQVQACVGDAATGVISVENLLVVGEQFGAWPKEVFLVDVEPGPERAGERLTPEIVDCIPHVIALLRRLAHDPINCELPITCIYGDTLFATTSVAKN